VIPKGNIIPFIVNPSRFGQIPVDSGAFRRIPPEFQNSGQFLQILSEFPDSGGICGGIKSIALGVCINEFGINEFGINAFTRNAFSLLLIYYERHV
jgi:hypothetical protein